MWIRTTTLVDNSDMVKALAYALYRERISTLDKLPKYKAMEILRDSIWWCGKVGWTGDSNCVSDIIGEFEAMDDYNACYDKAESYVNLKFPNL